MSNLPAATEESFETSTGDTRPAPLRRVGGAANKLEDSLPLEDRLALCRRIERDGISEVARLLDTPRHTVANAAAGCGLRKGTRLLLAQRLAALLAER